MHAQTKADFTVTLNMYFNENHGKKIQAAFADYMQKRRDQLPNTSVFDKTIDYDAVLKETIEFRKEFEKIEAAEYNKFINDFVVLKYAAAEVVAGK